MNKTGKTAFGGVITSISVAAMFLTTIFPFFSYVLPICAGILMIVANEELGMSWSFGIYSAVSVISLLILADKEAAIMYIVIFGYYPIIKGKIEHLGKVFALILKLIICNTAFVISYYIIIKIFGFSGEEFDEFGKYTIPMLIILSNILFLLTDFILSVLSELYKKRIKKHIGRIFK
ncbi:MAG: hypothetical protein BWY46_00553 [Firmicutes bacterium ADurb.Bin300]|nr:MAG: hypothetical protein BWY46_00553 [Firmicutes bacterium ADurb.Bin300]